MSKVTISKEVAAAITYLRTKEAYDTDDKLLLGHAGIFIERSRWASEEVRVLNDVPMDTFASAIINGYEVEKTSHDRVRDYYNSGDTSSLEAFAVKQTLNMLEITVEGVND